MFDGNVLNQGLVSNSTIETGITLTGGRLTGTTTNNGTIADVVFVGAQLSGGTLSGTITNSSQIGGTISNVQLAAGTTLKGGKLAGEISGVPEKPALITDAEIAPGTVLSHVHLSSTVQLPEDVVLGPGVGPATLEDFGLTDENLATQDEESLSQLEPAAWGVLDPEQLERIPPEAFTGIKSEQLAEISKETLAALTPEQFEQMPADALGGLTKDNLGGLSPDVINRVTPDHLDALDSDEFKQMPGEDVAKFLVYLDANKVSAEDVEPQVPPGWEIDPNTGALTAPVGTKVTLRALPPETDSSYPVLVVPNVSDIEAGFGLSGRGTPLKEGMNRSLEDENLTEFVISQPNEKNGVLIVEGTGESEGIRYSFIPDADNAIVVDTDQIPIGLSVDEGGFYLVTTPEGLQFKVIPTPHDPVGLSKALSGGEVIVGEEGDVLMEQNGQTQPGHSTYQVGIFDPLIKPAPEGVPSGLYLPESRTSSEPAMVVYSDGTMQTFKPTFLKPETFIEEGYEWNQEIKDIVFKADGTYSFRYKGHPYVVEANFGIEISDIDDGESVEAEIVYQNGIVTYTVAIDASAQSSPQARQPRKGKKARRSKHKGRVKRQDR